MLRSRPATHVARGEQLGHQHPGILKGTVRCQGAERDLRVDPPPQALQPALLGPAGQELRRSSAVHAQRRHGVVHRDDLPAHTQYAGQPLSTSGALEFKLFEVSVVEPPGGSSEA